MSIKFKIDGLKEIQAALRELPDATAKNVMRRILRKRAEPLADRAKSLAPVDDGELKDSIAVSTKLNKRQRSRHRKPDKDDVEVFVGAGPLPQAHLQEFGTDHSGPQPFMRPTWDSQKRGVLDGIKHDLWREVKKAAYRRRK